MPWDKDTITRLIEVEAQLQDVDPRLAVALAEQENPRFDPAARSPKGAIGIMQLMPKTALGLKVDPTDVAQNVTGGITYLKQQLDAFGGDTRMALAAYNAGPGVVKAYGKVPPYKETQGYVSRILGKLGPSSAEASTPQGSAAQPAPRSRLEEIEAELARREGQAAPSTATPPTSPQIAPGSTITPQRDTQEPPPPPDPSATPGMRFQALPSITQLEPADRIQKTRDFERLTPEMQEEFLRSEEPTAGGLAMGGGPVRQAQPVTDPAALLAGGRQAARPWREGDPLPPEAKRPPTPTEAPVTESLTAPSTMIPLLMPGAGLKLVPGALKTGAPLAYRGARAAAEGLSQTLGWTAGRTAETGEVPSPGEIGTEAALNVAAGGILEGLGATGQAILRRSQAGKAIVAADEATTAARQTWQQEVQAAQEAQAAGRTEAYQAAERRARAAQAQYQAKVEARDATIAANQQEYQDAVTAHRAEVQAEQTARYGQQRAETMHETATAQARQQQHSQAVAGQQQAITTARATPGRYTPETPSWVQYEKFGDAAKDAVVDLTPAKAALADVRASRGVLPDGSIRPFPQAVESIAANLEKATGETSFKTIREELRRLGPLTKSQDGNVRGAAKQLYGIYADVLEASPVANELLRNANATFRKEMAVQDIAEWLRPGHGIVRIDNQGRETINVGALLTRLEKTVADDSLFRRSFTPDELDALRADLRQLAGTPTMPRGQMPPAARPELLPGAAPNVPANMQQAPAAPAVPRDVPQPRQELLPGAAPGRRGTEEQRALLAPGAAPPEAVTPRQQLGERPKVFKDLTRTAMQDYMGSLFGVKPGLIIGGKLLWRGGQQLRYGIARAMLGVESRPRVMETLRKVQGVVGPPLYGTMINVLSDAERKALLRETREAREKRR